MKCNITFNKLKILAVSLTILATVAFCDVKPPKANPYKEDKSIYHSLYREKDSVERMSVYAQSIPTPLKA